jgi:hypothetical protein
MSNATRSKKPAPRKPTHTAYVVRDGKDDQSFWREIGSQWPHKDGKGFDLILDALPINGRIVIRLNEPKPKSED